MRTYTIIGGVNGAGKSSLAGVLTSERKDLGTIVNVDETAARMSVSNLEAGKIALTQIRELIASGSSFTQETTLSGSRILFNILAARKKGYTVRLYYVGLETLEESIQRIRLRAANGGHSVSEDDVTRRFKRRFESLLRILPYCHEAVFFDNGNGFVEIARFSGNQMTVKTENPPHWFSEFYAQFRKGRPLWKRL